MAKCDCWAHRSLIPTRKRRLPVAPAPEPVEVDEVDEVDAFDEGDLS